jgi:DNA-binding transcriptional ArsR family regulator
MAAKADLITHPARARIMTTMMGRRLTTNQLSRLMPDVPLPSLYRHLRTLMEGGVIDAVDEVRINGAANKVYEVVPGGGRIDRREVENVSEADHLRYFATFLNGLEQIFRAHLEAADTDGPETTIHCLMEPLYLSRAEYGQFCEGLQALLQPWRKNQPSEDRARVVFAHVILPDQPDPRVE